MRRLQREEPRVGVMELGSVSVHALRRTASQARYARVEGQELDHGQLDDGAGGEHEEDGQCGEQQAVQPAECTGGSAN